MHDVPKDLMDHIKKLEEIFTIDTPTLHKIVDVFVEELKKGDDSPHPEEAQWTIC